MSKRRCSPPGSLEVDECESLLEEAAGLASTAAIMLRHVSQPDVLIDVPTRRAIDWLEDRLGASAENLLAILVGPPECNTTGPADEIRQTLAKAAARVVRPAKE